MSSVNKAILIGRVGKDPETRYMPDGKAITNISLATSDSWKDKTTGEKKEKTEWHNITFYGKLAEIVQQYVKKGGQLYVEGKIETRKYTDKNGVEKYSTSINASEMQMVGGLPSQSQQETKQESKSDGFDDIDDDLPF